MRCLPALFLASILAAQPTPDQLARIRRLMQERLKHLANLTCLETIHRSASGRPGRSVGSDTLRLEVAFVNGKELFSRLNAGRFDERGVGQFGKGGAIESGLFATLIRYIFGVQGPVFRYSGDEILHGRPTVRYHYSVPLQASGYQIAVGPKRATVGFSGSFWADAETLQVLRLHVRADHIPIGLGLAESVQTIDYGRVLINEAELFLPERAELILTQLNGGQRHNRTDFSHWLQYVGESTLKFDDAPSAEKAESAIELPAGLSLDTRLETAIGAGRSRSGDRITAVVEKEVRSGGRVVIPAGAGLWGRIRSIEKAEDGFELALEFSELRIAGRKKRFFGRLSDVKSPGGAVRKRKDEGLLGIGVLQVRGDGTDFPRDLRMTWKMSDP
ncbi:MAG TPA: hypothetical protein VL285_10230 [Bryobacteraceae bacterium]|jgi:hypothetical protein|nr:hypothetical protein [Bryobacteraceae bacterium]